mgnify:CR=1 FL=1
MKGTINASIPDAKNIILNDTKEISEHATMVDLIRNDLSRVSRNVKVNKYRYYEEIATQDGNLGQVSSEIVGELDANYCENIGEIIFDLLPAGSISGAPKQKTIQIIAAAEKEMSDPALYTQKPARFAELTSKTESLRAEKDAAEERWLELAMMVEDSGS